ncbi:MAG: adventurous gliding motility protein CglE [Deltaproteobacteria bacterium]|nr:adventurous gliding motility protein CglE [Deltaproteobacteria bacterium]
MLIGCPRALAGSPKVQVYEEVEKGLEVGGQIGMGYDFRAPVESPGPGLLVGLEVGYDINWLLRVKGGFSDMIFTASRTSPRDQTLAMDFEERLLWAGASFSLLATKRFYMYVQAGLGYLFTQPKQIDEQDVAGADDLAILAGGGLEYYTTLRHISVGLEVNAVVLPIRGDVAIAVYPVLRYTFGFGGEKVIEPIRDRDSDGVPDKEDKCPDTPGVESQLGCPEPDRDGDGVPDSQDRCPDEPGPVGNDGCPLKIDRDGDGLPDKLDRCPDEPGLPANEGCPEEDSDLDGVPDRIDLCPTKRGKKEYDGCPKKSDIKIRVKKEAIELREKIHFETNRAIIKPKSYPILDQVAATLKQYPEIRKLEVQGHTDSRGGSRYNQSLSQRRAQAVVNYLTGKGIERERLEAKGYGEERPIAPNTTESGRAMNRRVEMIIMERR